MVIEVLIPIPPPLPPSALALLASKFRSPSAPAHRLTLQKRYNDPVPLALPNRAFTMKSPAWAVAGLCLLWTGLAWCTEGVRDARERADLQPGLVGADSIDVRIPRHTGF